MTAPTSGYRHGLLVPILFTLTALAMLIGLGTWQLERKTWKEALIARVNARLAAAPAELPRPEEWAHLTASDAEYRRVTFRADFRHDQEALVQAAKSAFRDDVSGVGYWVFTPAQVSAKQVLVNRGFVPEYRRDPASRPEGQVQGTEITGVLRWPEPRGWFTPADEPARNLFHARDPAAIARAKNLDAAPFYIEQEAPVPPGGLPHPSGLRVRLANDHLQYAITWYSLAAVLIGVFLVWVRGRQRSLSAEDRQVSAT